MRSEIELDLAVSLFLFLIDVLIDSNHFSKQLMLRNSDNLNGLISSD